MYIYYLHYLSIFEFDRVDWSIFNNIPNYHPRENALYYVKMCIIIKTGYPFNRLFWRHYYNYILPIQYWCYITKTNRASGINLRNGCSNYINYKFHLQLILYKNLYTNVFYNLNVFINLQYKQDSETCSLHNNSITLSSSKNYLNTYRKMK